jgi:geranylgeranylglycerol-phosphate geranylgeranyltransferase
VAIASIAGAQVAVALQLGLGMLLLQFSIGAANDYADAGADAIAKPWKPIPAELLARRSVALTCALAAAAGLVVAATVSSWAFILAVAGLADGLAYDLRLKATPVAWVSFAAGVGLLPLYAWLGAHGSAPEAFLGVVAMSVLAGAALAMSNAYADLERDRRSGVPSIAIFLGARRTLRVNAVLLGTVQIVAIATIIVGGVPLQLMLVELAGCGLGWFGFALAGITTETLRPLHWEFQAAGFVVLGIGWLAALNAIGVLGS